MEENTLTQVEGSVPKTFVVAAHDIVAPDQSVIERGDVGVLLSQSQTHGIIFFIKLWKQVELAINEYQTIDTTQLGDAFNNKICNVCHKLKNTLEFDKNQNGKGDRPIRRPSCHDCRKIIDGMDVVSSDRSQWDKTKPQNVPFECPICGKRTIAGVTSKVVLEHDHRTGKVGGWICDSCNTGLGRFKDDVEILNRAIKFLEKNY